MFCYIRLDCLPTCPIILISEFILLNPTSCSLAPPPVLLRCLFCFPAVSRGTEVRNYHHQSLTFLENIYNLLGSARHLRGGGRVGLGGLDVFQPHRVELAHLAPQVLQGQVGLGLSELAGRQLLLQAGDVILRYVLSLALTGLAKWAVS